MENIPEIKIIGNAPDSKKEDAREEIDAQLGDGHLSNLPEKELEYLRRIEYVKTTEEIEVLNLVNQETNELMKSIGIQSWDFPINNYHLIPAKEYKKDLKTGSAVAVPKWQAIIFDGDHFRKNIIGFASTAFHELIHLKGHHTFEVHEDSCGSVNTSTYRSGVEINLLQSNKAESDNQGHFLGLQEAIVSKLQKKFTKKILDYPNFSKEKSLQESVKINNLKNKIAKEKGVSVDEIIWVNKDSRGYEWSLFGYIAQRQVYSYLLEEIQTTLPNMFQSIDQVEQIFVKAHFSGHLLELANLVEEVFGKGSFRVLGSMTDTKDESVSKVNELLKEMRARVLKEAE